MRGNRLLVQVLDVSTGQFVVVDVEEKTTDEGNKSTEGSSERT